MKYSKLNIHTVPLGLIVELELTIWTNVIALIAARSDDRPILTIIYGQQAKSNVLGYVKIAEVVTGVAKTYKLNFWSIANPAAASACFQRQLKTIRSNETSFGFLFLSEFYDCSVVRYRSYSNLARIELHDLIEDLQRTHRNLSMADSTLSRPPVASPSARSRRSKSRTGGHGGS